MSDATPLREQLRGLPSIVGTPPPFDPAAAPDAPGALLLDWLGTAIAAGVDEPHAATLATVDADGVPDARVLIVKDVDPDGGCRIATGDGSAKGRQLIANPACALSFYWSPLARAVRIRGVAERAGAEESAADFSTRSAQARVIALAGRQSTSLPDEVERDRLLALAGVASRDGAVDPDWSVWRIRPVSIEFWQGDPGRRHLRLSYRRDGETWSRTRLWP